MASDSRTVRREAMVGWSTYNALVPWYPATTYQMNRARLWSTQFSSRKKMLQSLMLNGYLPTLPYTDNMAHVVNSKVVDLYGQLYADPRSVFEWHIIPNAGRVPVDAFDGNMNTLALMVQSKLQSKVSGHGFNTAVTAAEFGKTAGMISDRARSLYSAYRHARRGQWSAAARQLGLGETPKNVRNSRKFDENWLEYRYGWRLVVTDIESLMKTLYDAIVTRPPVIKQSAMEMRSYTQRTPISETLRAPNGTNIATVTGYKETTFKLVVRGGYLYQMESVPLATGQAFGLLNPFVVAAELIPFSFIVDWFVNVTDILEGLTAFVGKTYLDGWLCREIESSTDVYWTSVVKSPDIYSLSPGTTYTAMGQKDRKFDRRKMVFTPSQIRLEINLNLQKAIDALTLVTTGLRSSASHRARI